VSDRCLGVFAKYWEPGKVKTRLAQAVGMQEAAGVYEAFVVATISRFSQIDARRVLAYTPADEATRKAFSTLNLDGWALTSQSQGEMGTRIADFFERQFRQGARSVVLVASDSPNLPLSEVQRAFEFLEEKEVVLGPSEDGGYYLIGAAGKTPQIFDGIPWSTPGVLSATIQRLEQAGIDYALLEPWYDVDQIDDLQRLIEDLRGQEKEDPALGALLKEILKVIEEK
jgi:rSAM/selenodomain-associated transferase 1